MPSSSSLSRPELSGAGRRGLTEDVWVNQPTRKPRTKSTNPASRYLWTKAEEGHSVPRCFGKRREVGAKVKGCFSWDDEEKMLKCIRESVT